MLCDGSGELITDVGRQELDMPWATPEFSKRRVDKAGKEYVSFPPGFPERAQAAAIIDNWRAAHGYPLNTLQILLRNRARRVNKDAIVAQRLKRMSSIEAKLQMLGHFGLSRIQDIGGCRAVVRSIDDVKALVHGFHNGRDNHALKKEDDYVWEKGPRSTGYRSVHLVYAHQSQARPEYNGLLIEVQLRSRLQHAWATAVETVAAFTGQPLKAGEGDAEWLRFFTLMASEMALREKTPLVENTPTNRQVLRKEIRELTVYLNVVERLRAYQTAMSVADTGLGDGTMLHYFILARDAQERSVKIFGFTKQEVMLATKTYREHEADAATKPGSDVVLVSVEDFKTIRRAYPNYFADTSEFLKVVGQATREPSNGTGRGRARRKATHTADATGLRNPGAES